MVFFPSYRFLEQVYEEFFPMMGEQTDCIVQTTGMKEEEREEFLGEFEKERKHSLVGFCVMGGIFGEGIDLKEELLIGAIVVGTGLPQVGQEREILRQYFMKRIMTAYEKGTDYHIGMDSDCLIQAGADLEQLTWMDVRVGNYLPTPRHGKPVEINAYWYNDLEIMKQFALLQQDNKLAQHYAELADKVKEAFLLKFWNEEENCLKDVLSGNSEENQVRCNQVWVLSMPYTMLPKEKELCVLHKIKEELYTTAGLRTLSPKDSAFHDIYIGSMQERDRAYHQGTVWAFPLGAYYRAWTKYLRQDASDKTSVYKAELAEGIEAIRYWLEEGCLGQLAEIYDGAKPTVSRGCFAQAWSVGELLRAVYEWEQL